MNYFQIIVKSFERNSRVLERKQEDRREGTALEEFKLLSGQVFQQVSNVGWEVIYTLRWGHWLLHVRRWNESEQVEPTQMRARLKWWHQRQRHSVMWCNFWSYKSQQIIMSTYLAYGLEQRSNFIKYIKYFLKSSKGNFLLILGKLFAEQLAALKKYLFERSKETNFIYFLPGSSPSRSRVIRSGDGVSKEKLIYLEI